MVPWAGVEPARPFERGILSPLRLPISPPRQICLTGFNYIVKIKFGYIFVILIQLIVRTKNNVATSNKHNSTKYLVFRLVNAVIFFHECNYIVDNLSHTLRHSTSRMIDSFMLNATRLHKITIIHHF